MSALTAYALLSIGAVLGFFVCAVLTAGKVAELEEGERGARDEAATQKAIAKLNADACRLNQSKLSAIRDLLDKPRTIRKGELAMILDGEVA